MANDLSVSVSGSPYSRKLGAKFGFIPDDPAKDDQLYPTAGTLSKGFNVRAEVGVGLFVFGYQYDSFSGAVETRAGEPVDANIQTHLIVLGIGAERKLGNDFSSYLGMRMKGGYEALTHEGKTEQGGALSTELYPGLFFKTGEFSVGVSNPISVDFTIFVPKTSGVFFTLINPNLVLKHSF